LNLCVPDEVYLVDNPNIDSINILQETNINNSNKIETHEAPLNTRVELMCFLKGKQLLLH